MDTRGIRVAGIPGGSRTLMAGEDSNTSRTAPDIEAAGFGAGGFSISAEAKSGTFPGRGRHIIDSAARRRADIDGEQCAIW